MATPRGRDRRIRKSGEVMNRRPAFTAAVEKPERARVVVRNLLKKGMTLNR